VRVNSGAVAEVQACLRRRILRTFVGRGLLESCEAKEMLAKQHSGFSVDAGVCIQSHDRAGLERLRKAGSELVYRGAKQHSEPPSDRRGAAVCELHLTPLELIGRIATLVHPPASPLWGVGIEFAAQRSGYGDGTGGTGASHHGAGGAGCH